MESEWLNPEKVKINCFEWQNPEPKFFAYIVHGYGDHAKRYDELAKKIVEIGCNIQKTFYGAHQNFKAALFFLTIISLMGNLDRTKSRIK